MGRNGIGKSLLLKLLAGQHRPVAGKIEWRQSIGRLSQFVQEGECYVADFIGWGEPLRALERIEQGSTDGRDFDLLAEHWSLRNRPV